MLLVSLASFAIGGILLVAPPALAQEVAAAAAGVAGAAIDLTPLIDIAFQAVAVVVTALAGWAVQRYARRVGLEVDAHQRAVIEQVLASGIGSARQKLGQHVAWDPGSPSVATASDYVARSVPQALRHFGIDPRTPAGQEKLREMILARLPEPSRAGPPTPRPVTRLHSERT